MDTPELQQREKLVFVCSSAGKPVYSYNVHEERIAEIMATAQALVTVSKFKGENLKSIRWESGSGARYH